MKSGSTPATIPNRYLELLRRLQVSDQTFLIMISVIIGVVCGAGTYLFEKLLEISNLFFWELLPEWLGHHFWVVVLAPVLGGLLLAPFIWLFPKDATKDGVPATMEAVALENGFMKWTNAFLRMVMSALTLGSGGSAGSEGPIIQIGAALASGVGQALKVSGNRLRVIAACGAAAGLASIFNAPIAGVLFALEVIMGEFNVHSFSPIVISSVVATAFSRAFLHSHVLLTLPEFEPFKSSEIPFYALVGILAGLVSAGFTQTMHAMESVFHEQVPVSKALKPALGAVAVGLIGVAYPQVFGYSYNYLISAIEGHMLTSTLFILVFLKIVATAFTLGSGGSGGILCPCLFLGAMLGSGCGQLFHHWFPGLVHVSGAYGVVGMGAVLGAAVQAPMMAIIMAFELTNEYTVILPMMTACILATLMHKAFLDGSIYSIALTRKGIDIDAGREMGILASLRVADIMEPHVAKVRATATYDEVLSNLLRHPGNYLYVVDEDDSLQGVISFTDLKEFVFEEELRDLVLARDVANQDVVSVEPGESLATSMKKFSFIDMEQLPVVETHDGVQRIRGVLSRRRLLQVYHQELRKRTLIQSSKELPEMKTALASTHQQPSAETSKGLTSSSKSSS